MQITRSDFIALVDSCIEESSPAPVTDAAAVMLRHVARTTTRVSRGSAWRRPDGSMLIVPDGTPPCGSAIGCPVAQAGLWTDADRALDSVGNFWQLFDHRTSSATTIIEVTD